MDTPSQLLPSAAFPSFLADLLHGVAATLPIAEDEVTVAALAIADGQPRQAWQLIAPLIGNHHEDHFLWSLAFEALTLLGEAVELERLVTAYAEAFGELPPFALAAQERNAELKAAAHWQRWPATLTGEVVAALAASWAKKAPGGELASDVSQVTTVTPEAAQLLIEALGQWVKKGGKLRWRGLTELLNGYPGQHLLATAAEVQLAILWHRAAGHMDQAEALALEHALRFDTTPPEWCLTAAGTVESAAVGQTANANRAAVDLLLPEVITPHHTEALIHRLERKAEAGQRLTVDAARLRQWPVVELLTLGFALRRLPFRPRGHELRPLLCHHAPYWLQRVIPRVGLAPWVEFVDNNSS